MIESEVTHHFLRVNPLRELFGDHRPGVLDTVVFAQVSPIGIGGGDFMGVIPGQGDQPGLARFMAQLLRKRQLGETGSHHLGLAVQAPGRDE